MPRTKVSPRQSFTYSKLTRDCTAHLKYGAITCHDAAAKREAVEISDDELEPVEQESYED